jgi:type IV secretion system protein VirD4
MAGFGLKAYLITQDIRQIVDEYGANESIVSNCAVRVAFAPNQYETAELLSKMTGVKTIQKASFTFGGTRGSAILNHVSESVEQIRRPLMTPDEIMRIPPPLKSGEGQDEKIVAPGDMLVFASGHRPIYGKQMLYFLDSVLRMRAEMPPPTRFVTINSPVSEESCEQPATASSSALPSGGLNRGREWQMMSPQPARGSRAHFSPRQRHR